MQQNPIHKKYFQYHLLLIAVSAALFLNNCFSTLDGKMAHEKIQSVSLGGISLDYKNDDGIENHPAVVFTDNFEDATVGAYPAKWDNAWGSGRITADGEGVHHGNQGLEFKILAKRI